MSDKFNNKLFFSEVVFVLLISVVAALVEVVVVELFLDGGAASHGFSLHNRDDEEGTRGIAVVLAAAVDSSVLLDVSLISVVVVGVVVLLLVGVSDILFAVGEVVASGSLSINVNE